MEHGEQERQFIHGGSNTAEDIFNNSGMLEQPNQTALCDASSSFSEQVMKPPPQLPRIDHCQDMMQQNFDLQAQGSFGSKYGELCDPFAEPQNQSSHLVVSESKSSLSSWAEHQENLDEEPLQFQQNVHSIPSRMMSMNQKNEEGRFQTSRAPCVADGQRLASLCMHDTAYQVEHQLSGVPSLGFAGQHPNNSSRGRRQLNQLWDERRGHMMAQLGLVNECNAPVPFGGGNLNPVPGVNHDGMAMVNRGPIPECMTVSSSVSGGGVGLPNLPSTGPHETLTSNQQGHVQLPNLDSPNLRDILTSNQMHSTNGLQLGLEQQMLRNWTSVQSQNNQPQLNIGGDLAGFERIPQPSNETNTRRASALMQGADVLDLPHKSVKRRRTKTFPQKFMDALLKYASEDAVTWLPDGKSFVVVDDDVFVQKVLSHDFKASKYSSFVRKLHRWGFVRLTSVTGKDCFHHPLFQKGRIDLAGDITSTQHSKQPTKKSKLQGLPGADAEHSFLNSEESEIEIPEPD